MLALSSLSLKRRHFLSVTSLIFKQNPNPNFQFHTLQFFSSSSDQSWLSVPGKPLISWPLEPCAPPNPHPDPNPNPSPGADLSQNEFAAISELLENPNISGGLSLHTALDRTGIEPSPILLQAVFDHFDSSPSLLYSLFLWAEKQPGFGASASLFSSVINVLAKSREFDSAWSLILDRIGKPEGLTLVSGDTFVIMIRRYARAGMFQLVLYIFTHTHTYIYIYIYLQNSMGGNDKIGQVVQNKLHLMKINVVLQYVNIWIQV